jgi:hypothetical protein
LFPVAEEQSEVMVDCDFSLLISSSPFTHSLLCVFLLFFCLLFFDSRFFHFIPLFLISFVYCSFLLSLRSHVYSPKLMCAKLRSIWKILVLQFGVHS